MTFSQKPEMGYSKDRALKLNYEEVEHYKATLEHTRTKYQIDDIAEQDDGFLVVHVRKQYNNRTDVSEYFN